MANAAFALGGIRPLAVTLGHFDLHTVPARPGAAACSSVISESGASNHFGAPSRASIWCIVGQLGFGDSDAKGTYPGHGAHAQGIGNETCSLPPETGGVERIADCSSMQYSRIRRLRGFAKGKKKIPFRWGMRRLRRHRVRIAYRTHHDGNHCLNRG